MKKIICFVIIMVVFLCACRKPVRYSDIPEIKFISFEKYKDYLIVGGDTVLEINGGILIFYFQDGNGDIGLNNEDTIRPPFNTLPYKNNFFCDYYEKQNGIFIKIDSVEDTKGKMIPFNFNACIPRLSLLPEESINGEIYLNISPNYYDISSPYNDTIQLKFYILDRKLNKSNTEEVIIIR